MDLVSPHQIKSPYIAAQFTAYVGIFCIKLAILFIVQQQMYWKFMSNETLLETNVQNKKPVPDKAETGLKLLWWSRPESNWRPTA